MTAGAFDLALSYPQWQGSGRPENLPRGAGAAAEICARHAPLARVPIAGEGDAAGGVHRWSAILDQFRAARAILAAHRPQRLLTAGGDCAVDVAVIDYLLGIHPGLTVIWIDAHLDANTPSTSPSGNFHGMPVASLMSAAPAGLAPLLGAPLAPARFRYLAAHVGDAGDWQFQKRHGLQWWDGIAPIAGPVHVHFDLDALDPIEFPHVAYPEGNLPMAAGLAAVRSAAREGGLVGLTITEFAPADADAATDGGRFIAQLCEAAIGR